MNSGNIFKVFSIVSGTSVTAQKMLLNKVSYFIKWLLNCLDGTRTQRILHIFLVTLFVSIERVIIMNSTYIVFSGRPGSPFFMERVKLVVTCH